MKALLAFWGVIAASGCGEGAKGGCPALASCGGDPVGTWSVIDDSCQFQPVRPAQPVDVTAFGTITPPTAMIAPPQPNPVVLQQTTSGDWCSNLVYTENPDPEVLNVVLWHDAPLLTTAKLTFGPDFSYLTALTFSTVGLPAQRNTTHFAPRCLLANGAPSPTCAKLATALASFYMSSKPGVIPANFDQIECGDASDGGCDCTYVYTVAVSDSGMWKADGGSLLQDSTLFLYNGTAVAAQSPATTLETSFCARGGALQLTGNRGGSLFGILGLRTLVLAPPP
ncbi:MAG TPA: hypothetical protein VMT47_05720 [Polyangia bacterium]|nr:hypothetical protein [Polyangia bacterium]